MPSILEPSTYEYYSWKSHKNNFLFPTHFFPCTLKYIVRKMVAAIYARILFARAARRKLHTLLYILWQKKAFFHFGTQFFTFGFFCTSSIFLFGLRRRRHSVCTLNATIGSSILSEIFGNHKLSYYIVVHTTESIVLCAAAAATAVWRIFWWRCERRQ